MSSGYSGVRLIDGLGYQPRSKTFLNGKQQDVLIVSQGRAIELQNGEDEKPQAPTRVEIAEIGATVHIIWWDPLKDKVEEIKIVLTREYFETMKANTIAMRRGNPLPWYIDHYKWGESHGWFRAEDLEITDTALIANNIQWVGETAQLIVERRYLYCSIGWFHNYRDYRTDKEIGPALRESSLTNDPFLVGQRGLAASGGDMLIAAAVPVDAAANLEEAEMLEKLRGLLGLSAEATEEEIGTAVMAAVAAGAELAEIDKALESVEGADRAAKLATLTTAKPAEKEPEVKPDPEKGTTDPEKGTAGMGAAAAKILVGAAVKAGQIPPAEEAQFVADFAVLSLDTAERVLGLMGASVPKGGDLKGKADGGAEGYRPSKKQLRACSLSEADWEKYGNLKEEGGDED